MTIQIDPRATALGVYVQDNPIAKWKLIKFQYQDDKESQGQHNIYYTVLGKDGLALAGIPIFMDWIGRNPKEDDATKVLTDANGQANVGMYANLDTTKKNGAYFSYVQLQGLSDVVYGMGLPEHHHVNFILTFQDGGAVTPPPPQPTGTWQVVSQDATHLSLVLR